MTSPSRLDAGIFVQASSMMMTEDAKFALGSRHGFSDWGTLLFRCRLGGCGTEVHDAAGQVVSPIDNLGVSGE